MVILGIETSCDETAAAVLKQDKKGIHILSNVIASSANLQAKNGGIIPEQAAREQIKSIIPVIEEALIQSNLYPPSSKNHLLSSTIHRPVIDAIAVTYGPGLIGSLLVGVETAKVLATVWNKPLIPINHLIGHFYANWIENQYNVSSIKYSGRDKSENPSIPYTLYPILSFPCLGLLVSGGHTDLVLFTDHGKYKYLGGTRDDAAGECFDKCARLLGLPYPGGPQISKLAQKGDPTKFKLPVPMKGRKDFDFSYSGLKTAVANIVKALPVIPSETRNLSRMRVSSETSSEILRRFAPQDDDVMADLAASIEDTIVKSLVDKVMMAIQKYEQDSSSSKVEQVMIAGGVAANQKLSSELKLKIENLQFDKNQIGRVKLKINLHIPSANLCTDNGAMIASAAFFGKAIKNPLDLQANPNLSLLP